MATKKAAKELSLAARQTWKEERINLSHPFFSPVALRPKVSQGLL